MGKDILDKDNPIFALPVRYGGLCIANPLENCDRECAASRKVTEDLTAWIVNQDNALDNYDFSKMKEPIKPLKSLRHSIFIQLPELSRTALFVSDIWLGHSKFPSILCRKE